MTAASRTRSLVLILLAATAIGCRPPLENATPAWPAPPVDPLVELCLKALAESNAAAELTDARLARKLPVVDLQSVKLANAMDWFAAQAGVTVESDWPRMEQLGITRDTVVSLQLRDVVAGTALAAILRQAAGRRYVLDFWVRGGLVRVGTAEELPDEPKAHSHDVSDILAAMADYDRRQAERLARKRPRLIPASAPDVDSPNTMRLSELEESREERRFHDLLRQFIYTESWDPTGPALNMLNGLLLVETPLGTRARPCRSAGATEDSVDGDGAYRREAAVSVGARAA